MTVSHGYDIEEARVILARSHEKRDPMAHSDARGSAARRLVDAVLEAAKDAGYDVGPERGVPGVHVVSHAGRGCVYIRLVDDVLQLVVRDIPGRPRTETPQIVFDPSLNLFVGMEADSYREVIPGHPRSRRSAVAVVADDISRLISAQVPGR